MQYEILQQKMQNHIHKISTNKLNCYLTMLWISMSLLYNVMNIH